MTRQSFPDYIIISGSGKKVGKTYMATALIRAFSGRFPLVAVKISPHVHDSLGNTRLRAESEGIRIFQDLGPHPKNSGQFLEAGAMESFFIETNDRHLGAAFDMFREGCNPLNHPVVCESGALSSLIRPGVLIFIMHSETDLQEHKKTTMRQADIVLPARTFSTRQIIDRITFNENRWQRFPA
jgi:hypothetical protein